MDVPVVPFVRIDDRVDAVERQGLQKTQLCFDSVLVDPVLFIFSARHV